MKVKRTLQEWADFTGCYVAVDEDGGLYLSQEKPQILGPEWYAKGGKHLRVRSWLHDYSGDWKDSLTMPSEPPFDEGQLVVGIQTG